MKRRTFLAALAGVFAGGATLRTLEPALPDITKSMGQDYQAVYCGDRIYFLNPKLLKVSYVKGQWHAVLK